MRRERVKIYPLPEIQGDRVTIEEGQPSVTLPTRRTKKSMIHMDVPLGDSEQAHAARYHESMHVAYTPRSLKRAMFKAGVKDMYAQPTEDLRIGLIAANQLNRPFELKFDEMEVERFQRFYNDPGDRAYAASIYVSVSQCPSSEDLIKGLPETEQNKLRTMGNLIQSALRYGRVKSNKSIVRAALLLQSLLDEKGETQLGSQLASGRGCWGAMKIIRLPMPLHQRGVNGMRPSNETGSLVFPASLDGRVLGQIKRRTGIGGSILIDGSGSMCSETTNEQITEALRYLPAATIGVYSADCSELGTLRIVAENGRRAQDVEGDYGGGNLIDFPALKWLATQPGPRAWVSDAQVTIHTSRGEVFSEEGQLQCLALCQARGIKRLTTLERAARWVRGQNTEGLAA